MTNEMNPPAGEVKPPHLPDDFHELLREAAMAVQRFKLPLKADATIKEAADEMAELLYQEHCAPYIQSSDTSLVKHSDVLDHGFYTMMCKGMDPKHPFECRYLDIGLRMQRQLQSTVQGLHNRRKDRLKNPNL